MAPLTLVSLDYCKATLSLDDRDDPFVTPLLEACSKRIEGFLLRNIRERTFTHYFDSQGQRELYLAEYPVREVLSLYSDPAHQFSEETRLPPEAWYCPTVPHDIQEDLPSAIVLDSFLAMPKGRKCLRVIYRAGYPLDQIPEDLKLATAELVAWTFRRLKTKQVGVSGLVTHSARTERTVFETTLPENVKAMLEPYRRRTL